MNVVWPRAELTESVPDMRSASSEAIASPSPDPCTSSPVKKGSKTRGSASGSMPWPSSRTAQSRQAGQLRHLQFLIDPGRHQARAHRLDLVGHLLPQGLVAAQQRLRALDRLGAAGVRLGPPLQAGGDDGVGLVLRLR